MSIDTNAQNLFFSNLFFPFLARFTTALQLVKSTVDRYLRKPNWYSGRPFYPVKLVSILWRTMSSRSLPIVCNRHIGLYDEALSRGLTHYRGYKSFYFEAFFSQGGQLLWPPVQGSYYGKCDFEMQHWRVARDDNHAPHSPHLQIQTVRLIFPPIRVPLFRALFRPTLSILH